MSHRFQIGPVQPGAPCAVADSAGISRVVERAVAGESLEILVTDHDLAALLYDELRRIGPVRIGERLPPATVDDDQRRLLQLLAEGTTVREAASRANLSLRTTYRRLAEARQQLGVTTNLAAFQRLEDDRPEIGSL